MTVKKPLKKHLQRVGLIFAFVAILAFILINGAPVSAQGGATPSDTPTVTDPNEPIEILDAMFFDLSGKIGQPVGRDSTPYRWRLEVFASKEMGCRTPGKAYTPQLTKGYVLWTQVKVGRRFQQFYYRAYRDGTVLFECTKVGPGPQIKVPDAPITEETYNSRRGQTTFQGTPGNG